jgi:hypothetical protein
MSHVFIVTGTSQIPYEGYTSWNAAAYTDHRRAYAHMKRAQKWVEDNEAKLQNINTREKLKNPHDSAMYAASEIVMYEVEKLELV